MLPRSQTARRSLPFESRQSGRALDGCWPQKMLAEHLRICANSAALRSVIPNMDVDRGMPKNGDALRVVGSPNPLIGLPETFRSASVSALGTKLPSLGRLEFGCGGSECSAMAHVH